MLSSIRKWLIKKLGGVPDTAVLELVDKLTDKTVKLSRHIDDLIKECDGLAADLAECRRNRGRDHSIIKTQRHENRDLKKALDQACEAWFVKTKSNSALVVTNRIYSQLVPSSFACDKPELEQELRARGKVVE